jgi:hypothetical protein
VGVLLALLAHALDGESRNVTPILAAIVLHACGTSSPAVFRAWIRFPALGLIRGIKRVKARLCVRAPICLGLAGSAASRPPAGTAAPDLDKQALGYAAWPLYELHGWGEGLLQAVLLLGIVPCSWLRQRRRRMHVRSHDHAPPQPPPACRHVLIDK